MWELDCEESWVPKNWCIWTMVLEKTLESPLDCKEIQPVHSKGDQPWVFFGRNDAKAETLVVWPPHEKSWLIGKDSEAGRDWGQKEKGTTEDEMAVWHHWLNGREFEWSMGVGDRQGGLACCDSRGRKESDTTEQLNWTCIFYWHNSANIFLEKYSHTHNQMLLAHFFLVHFIQCDVEELRIYLFDYSCRQEHPKTTPKKANLVIFSFYSILS